MMFGNVAPAPVSRTCAAAGAAAQVRAARTRRRRFVMTGALGMIALERELALEQRLRPGRDVGGVQGVRLEVQVVPVEQQPPVGRELVGDPADDPRVLGGGV